MALNVSNGVSMSDVLDLRRERIELNDSLSGRGGGILPG
jgi:hypothetical protein